MREAEDNPQYLTSKHGLFSGISALYWKDPRLGSVTSTLGLLTPRSIVKFSSKENLLLSMTGGERQTGKNRKIKGLLKELRKFRKYETAVLSLIVRSRSHKTARYRENGIVVVFSF